MSEPVTPFESGRKVRRLAPLDKGGKVRRLAAIVCADIVNYSRLMGNNEEGTHERLKSLLRDTVNPAVVEGQHQGGFAQGLGVVLFEEVRYSEDGQPLCTTLLDYTIPTALEVPVLRVVHRPTPSAAAGGFRGMGEASIIATPAVMVAAVEDALRPLGAALRSTRLHAAPRGR